MSVWNRYPATYRSKEIQEIYAAVRAGECVAVVGLSGAGKSNLLGFMAARDDVFTIPNVLVDCNRLQDRTVDAVFRLLRSALGDNASTSAEWSALDVVLTGRLKARSGSLCILFDRFDILSTGSDPAILNNLRALRDAYKYQLTYVTATRQPLDPYSEVAELFYAHTLWLGALSREDTRWNVTRYARRLGQTWGKEVQEKIWTITWGYPSLLRAVCEAFAAGADLDPTRLSAHPAVQRRIQEFWRVSPSENDLKKVGLVGHPLLFDGVGSAEIDTTQLTAKEMSLLEYLRSHPDRVCAKDDLIRAVWPEDHIYEQGVRDDSLAQLIRRLRVKIEADPSDPQRIQTVPGRGYLFKSGQSR